MISVIAHWPARPESVESCARRLSELLNGLASTHAQLSRWYRRAKSRKKALDAPIPTGAEELVPILLKRQNRRDFGGEVIAELGFAFGAWNGASGNDGASLDVTCGLYSTTGLLNAVVLDLPELAELEQAERVAALLELVKRCYEPTWAGAIDFDDPEQVAKLNQARAALKSS